MLIAVKKQKALFKYHKTRKVVNGIQNDNHGVLCGKWDSVCFVLLANTCLVVAAVHQD